MDSSGLNYHTSHRSADDVVDLEFTVISFNPRNASSEPDIYNISDNSMVNTDNSQLPLSSNYFGSNPNVQSSRAESLFQNNTLGWAPASEGSQGHQAPISISSHFPPEYNNTTSPDPAFWGLLHHGHWQFSGPTYPHSNPTPQNPHSQPPASGFLDHYNTTSFSSSERLVNTLQPAVQTTISYPSTESASNFQIHHSVSIHYQLGTPQEHDAAGLGEPNFTSVPLGLSETHPHPVTPGFNPSLNDTGQFIKKERSRASPSSKALLRSSARLSNVGRQQQPSRASTPKMASQDIKWALASRSGVQKNTEHVRGSKSVTPGLTDDEKMGGRKRRKKYADEERRKVNQVRLMKACVRCRLNKRSCSVEEVCSGCHALLQRIGAHPSLLKYICFRHSLYDLRYGQIPWDMRTPISGVLLQYVLTTPKGTVPSRDLFLRMGATQLEHLSSTADPSINLLAENVTSMMVEGKASRSLVPILDALIPEMIKNDQKLSYNPEHLYNCWHEGASNILQERTKNNPGRWHFKKLFDMLISMNQEQILRRRTELEENLVSASFTFCALHSFITLTLLSTENALTSSGHPPELYLHTLFYIDSILLQLTDKWLNKIGQLGKEGMENLVTILQVWELRFNFSQQMYTANQYCNVQVEAAKLKGLEVSISGIRTALVQRGNMVL